jgi:hypothetical protein
MCFGIPVKEQPKTLRQDRRDAWQWKNERDVRVQRRDGSWVWIAVKERPGRDMLNPPPDWAFVHVDEEYKYRPDSPYVFVGTRWAVLLPGAETRVIEADDPRKFGKAKYKVVQVRRDVLRQPIELILWLGYY